MEVFHNFYLRIEEIHEFDYKSVFIEPIKCDVTVFEQNDLKATDESQLYASAEPKDFENLSNSDDNFFGNDGK